MADRLTPQQRSDLMRRVHGKDTAPEMIVRRLLDRAGFRFRLHRKDLPGKPDLCLPSRQKAIFVMDVSGMATAAKSGACRNRAPNYWEPKILRNQERDAGAVSALAEPGWEALTIWQCETKDKMSLAQRLVEFLGQPNTTHDEPHEDR